MAENVLVYLEQRSGVIAPASLRMFTAAQLITTDTGGAVHAVIVGHQVADLADELAKTGADHVHVVDAPALEHYRALPYTRVIEAAVAAASAGVVLFATSCLSRDLAPRLAARLDAALATDCLGLARENGELRVRRPMYCAKCVGELALASDRLQIVSIRANAFAATNGGPRSSAPITRLEVTLSDDDDPVTVRDVVPTSGESRDLADAEIVVSGGRSLQSEENFSMLHELAAQLDGAVGASRAAVDAGYQPQNRQVGLTGKVVTPQLYIACGIDGAIQHLAGMRGSKVIVAINTKADAPIFGVATYGCVADLFTLVPMITEECRRLEQT
jgi:electron transfer flavoprotein alpha subunit